MEIHWKGLEGLPPGLRVRVQERLEALAAAHRDLIDVRLAGKPTQHHVHGGQEVRIAAQVRGTAQVVAARTRADLGLALDEAMDAFEREMRRLREKRMDARYERPPEPPELGVVDRVFAAEGYGFILTDAGERVYFHRNAVSNGLRFQELEEGQRVGLQFEAGDEGLQATAVTAAPPDAPVP